MVEDRLKELGIESPPWHKPLGLYLPYIEVGNLIFLSGILPLKEGELPKKGIVGQNITIPEAQEYAKITVINALSILKAHLGDLNKIKRCIKMTGYIASAHNFYDQPLVLNSASNLLIEIFGDAGKHARSAIGVNALPLNSPLELEFIFEIH
jgi:enamine deaminase RidA (YjgF/YER057c/UK114 family)